jgi:uncharacterized protein (TIGR03437 family)
VPNPGSLVFTAQTGQGNPVNQTIGFSASDNSLNPLAITATTSTSWIKIVNSSSAFVTVGVDASSLSTGTYTGTISVTQANAANSPFTVPVTIVVNGGGGGGGGGGTLSFSPSTSLSFSSVNGSTPAAQTLTVSASSTTSFVVQTITYGKGSGWLTVNPSSGVTTSALSVSVNPAGLAADTYTANIPFNANGVIQNVAVTLTVSNSSGGGGNVTVSPTSLSFSAQQGSSPSAQNVSVSSASGSSGIPFTVQVTSGSNFLSTSATANPSTPYSFTASINSNSLTAGSYSGNIRITPTGGTVVDIPVSLTITAPPTVTASPTSMTFNYRAGDNAPAAQALTISGGGASLGFTATASSTGNWLAVSAASGTTPSSVNVSVNPANLSAGIYNGTVTVAGSGGAAGSTAVSVTLNVTAPLPTITKVTNAASYATGSIAPGEIITLFASDSQHPIGPATPVGLTLDSSGAVSTTIGGVQVLINGFACPMIYASASQVSAVVPYQLKLYTSATILVKYLNQTSNGVGVNVATTTPGVFTANSSGTGPGAILNSNLSVNSPANPATRGDTVVVYLTGEGETSPAGVTGKVTTVSSTPPITPVPLLPISVTVGGQGANYTFAGQAPGLVSGVLQLNVVTPTNIAAGDQAIVVTIGGNPSQQGVTVSLK